MTAPQQSAPTISVEAGEFRHIVRTLEGIQSRASNLLVIAEAIDVRAGNEFAESMRIVRETPESPIPGLLAKWQQAYNACAEADMCPVDGLHAVALGLPALAALSAALDRVRHARGPVSPVELEDLLRGILQVARGEATERIRHILGDPTADGVPGVGTIPRKLLERLEGGAQ